MEASKRKKIETQLRRLLEAADQESSPKEQQPAPRHMGNIQVIRKRKGQPDQCIISPCSE